MTENAQKAMHAKHSAERILRSGNTVRSAVSIIEDEAAKFVKDSVDQVSEVAQDTEAFSLIYAELTDLFAALERHLTDAVKLATSGVVERHQSVQNAGQKLFGECRDRMFKRLEIHRFSFVKPSRGDLADDRERLLGVIQAPAQEAQSGNPGGKPLAKHWDAMWAEIATQLWTGDLKPDSQADIKRAMFDWLTSKGIEVGDTAVTERARALWQRMQAET